MEDEQWEEEDEEEYENEDEDDEGEETDDEQGTWPARFSQIDGLPFVHVD